MRNNGNQQCLEVSPHTEIVMLLEIPGNGHSPTSWGDLGWEERSDVRENRVWILGQAAC